MPQKLKYFYQKKSFYKNLQNFFIQLLNSIYFCNQIGNQLTILIQIIQYTFDQKNFKQLINKQFTDLIKQKQNKFIQYNCNQQSFISVKMLVDKQIHTLFIHLFICHINFQQQKREQRINKANTLKYLLKISIKLLKLIIKILIRFGLAWLGFFYAKSKSFILKFNSIKIKKKQTNKQRNNQKRNKQIECFHICQLALKQQIKKQIKQINQLINEQT
ncbi:hypothetical protein TTHERM_000016369 (macronuclear) [Tetrahymena thermophila SB210]|uniref:Uncharacterized protein n=1 Tax=Tetrahymena thermophila (strain SB210) TaxID=312017 RepID=W7XKB9_TETTS|nr:hypothetical protein TTHERM_000016369 [Tetrahymena thermophila SB210]EWS76381.1 hypothetical protein TTHERM_000016369 [Tetrahymena thermophila SB210]|eukprot:XP_012651165.1 hypothetical protein TTHERM_000016369 [Tetrahymena thermophila SB210]